MHNVVRGLSRIIYKVDLLCDAYQKGKQIRGSFESKNIISTYKPIELLHINLFGPTGTSSLGGKHYGIFYEEHGIHHNFSYPRTPQQNGIERKNRSIQEMVKTMLNDFNFPKYFWTPYECERVDNPTFLNSTLSDVDNLDKFDPKSDKGIFIRYLTTSKAYRVYNSKTLKVEESIHVKFNDSKPNKELLELTEPFVELNIEELYTTSKELIELELDQPSKTKLKWLYYQKLNPRIWILAMHEELDWFQKNDVWKLVSPPNDKFIIGTKWIFRNKLDENGKVMHNKTRLVAQGYSQQEGINFIELLLL
ncbi:putative mitochondrial protein, partial [Mucuna pruriens]